MVLYSFSSIRPSPGLPPAGGPGKFRRFVGTAGKICYSGLVIKLRDIGKKININGPLLPDEPLSLHTSFRTGGPADLMALPRSLSDLRTLLDFSREESIPWMVLGGGANRNNFV